MRRLLDLDADPAAVDAALGARPELGTLVTKRPGLRSPGTVDGFELAVRAVVGQQVSVAGAGRVLARLVEAGRTDGLSRRTEPAVPHRAAAGRTGSVRDADAEGTGGDAARAG